MAVTNKCNTATYTGASSKVCVVYERGSERGLDGWAPNKNDFGGIRTHARKTAALTQRLRPLGHEVVQWRIGESNPRPRAC